MYKELSESVQNALLASKVNDKTILTVGILLIILHFYSLFSIWLSVGSATVYLFFCCLLGTICLPIFLNIGHEAIHGTFSKNSSINSFAKNAFLLLGTSDYFWKLRHISSHHALSNVEEWDVDISQTKLIRLSDHQVFQKHHRKQHWYMPFLFLLYTLVWFIIRDFQDIFKKDFGVKYIEKHPTKDIIRMLLAKIWHISTLIILPIVLGAPIWLVITGFLVFHFSASLVTTFALVSTHVGTEQEIVQSENGVLPYSWLEHQFRTTGDFDTDNVFMNWFFGGFNHHITHHLFPTISHIYYPEITPIVKKFADQYQLPYYHSKSLRTAASAHIKRLQFLSIKEEL